MFESEYYKVFIVGEGISICYNLYLVRIKIYYLSLLNLSSSESISNSWDFGKGILGGSSKFSELGAFFSIFG